MSAASRVSFYLTDDEKAILDATAARMKVSRSEVFRHLVIYHGLCGGDFPLTTKILALPAKDRERVLAEIRARAESADPAKPQKFQKWVKETIGSDDPAAMERGADVLMRKLLEG